MGFGGRNEPLAAEGTGKGCSPTWTPQHSQAPGVPPQRPANSSPGNTHLGNDNFLPQDLHGIVVAGGLLPHQDDFAKGALAQEFEIVEVIHGLPRMERVGQSALGTQSVGGNFNKEKGKSKDTVAKMFRHEQERRFWEELLLRSTWPSDRDSPTA